MLLAWIAVAACASAGRVGDDAPRGLDADMGAVLRELGELEPKPIERLDAAAARRQPSPADAAVQVAQRNGDLAPDPTPAVGKVESTLVPGVGGAQLLARVYTPPGDGPFPVVVYFHGGGWVLATVDTYDASCRALCAGAGAVVVSVQYRKAPEHKFPTAHEDAYAAAQHVIANASAFDGDPARVAVAGESVGGNLATGVCILAHERGGAMPLHQVLVYPVTGVSDDTPSYREHGAAKPLNAAMMAWFYDQYLRGPADRRDRLVAPLAASTTTLRALPPATVITAEFDPLRSEGLDYATRLRELGVQVEVRDYAGVAHEFFGMGPLVAKSVDAQQFVAARLRDALGGAEAAVAAGPRREGMRPRDDRAPPSGKDERAERGVRDASGERASGRADAAADRGGRGLAVVRGGAARGERDARLEEVARFPGPAMPTGVAVSRSGRIFVCFPRWGDVVEHTAVELRAGSREPYPDAASNAWSGDIASAAQKLVNVQSIVVDAEDTLWLVDSGSVELGPVIPGAPKLCRYDLQSDRLVRTYTFPNDVVRKRTYLNDVRVDRRRGAGGFAYLTDSGAGGIVVVDLATGRSWRHLDGSPAMLPTPGLRLTNEGETFFVRAANGERQAPDIRADGIAMSPDGRTLYVTPLMSRELFAIPTDLLAEPATDPARLAAAVVRVASKPSANDGLECSRADGAVFSTDWEDSAIRRIDPANGAIAVVVQDERLIWPDTLAWGGANGADLYVMSNQLARQARFRDGVDQRSPPYVLFRIRDAATRR